jgi:hypothetical protein
VTDVRDNKIYQCGNESCETLMVIDDPKALGDPCAKCGFIGKRQVPVIVVCDFCSESIDGEWCWSYPARDFLYTIQFEGCGTHGSKGEWAACDRCHELIEAGDRSQLAARNVALDVKRDPKAKRLAPQLYRLALGLHDDFFHNRTGDPVHESPLDHFQRKLREESE